MRLVFLSLLLFCFSCEPEIIEVKIDLNEYLIGEWEVVEDGFSIRNGIRNSKIYRYQNDFEDGGVNLRRIERGSSEGIVEKWLHGKWWVDDINNYLHMAHQFGEVDSGVPFDGTGTIQSYLSYLTFEIKILNRDEFTTIRDMDLNDSTSVFYNYTYKRL